MKCALSIAIYPCLSICEAFSILKLGSETCFVLAQLSCHPFSFIQVVGKVTIFNHQLALGTISLMQSPLQFLQTNLGVIDGGTDQFSILL